MAGTGGGGGGLREVGGWSRTLCKTACASDSKVRFVPGPHV